MPKDDSDDSDDESVPGLAQAPAPTHHNVKPRKGQEDEEEDDSSSEKDQTKGGQVDLERSIAEAK